MLKIVRFCSIDRLLSPLRTVCFRRDRPFSTGPQLKTCQLLFFQLPISSTLNSLTGFTEQVFALFALFDYFITNYSHCSSFAQYELFALFKHPKCSNSANERTTNTFVLSSLDPGICMPVFLAKNLKSKDLKSEKKLKKNF